MMNSSATMPESRDAKSTLPSEEVAICERLREVREVAEMSQPALARRLGIPHLRLASYEYARAPVPYAIGREVCRLLDINQRWLATGAVPKKLYIDVNPILESELPLRVAFSRAYQFLSPTIEARMRDVAAAVEIPLQDFDRYPSLWSDGPSVGASGHEGILFYLSKIHGANMLLLPERERGEYFKAVVDAGKQVRDRFLASLDQKRPIMEQLEEIERKRAASDKSLRTPLNDRRASAKAGEEALRNPPSDDDVWLKGH